MSRTFATEEEAQAFVFQNGCPDRITVEGEEIDNIRHVGLGYFVQDCEEKNVPAVNNAYTLTEQDAMERHLDYATFDPAPLDTEPQKSRVRGKDSADA